METYNPKQAAEKVGVSIRAVQKRCNLLEVRKVDNVYQITNDFINSWIKERTSTRTNEPNERTSTQLDIEVESLKTENEKLTNELRNIKRLKNIQLFELDKIEDFDFEFNGIKGNLVFISKGKSYTEHEKDLETMVLTPSQFQIFEQRLQEWEIQRSEINHQKQIIENNEKHFNIQIASKDDLITHYHTQFDYQRQQSDKILSIHQKLVDTIDQQVKIIIQKQVMEAIDKDIIKKDTWKPK